MRVQLLHSTTFLRRITAVQSVKESATYIARFEIRLANRHSDQRRSRSSALWLGTTLFEFFLRRVASCLGIFVVSAGLRARQISSLSIVSHLSRGL
jgi:hypothetical protein